MGFFANPRNLMESFGLVSILFRFTGLFPFSYNTTTNEFQISRKLFSITIIQLTIYIYVNVTSLMENWYDYSQPMLGHSSLTIFGNLNLRLLDILITFLVFWPAIMGNRKRMESLNLCVRTLDELVLMGIDVSCIYRRLYHLSWIFSVIWISLMALTAWHSIYFFEIITQRPPEMKYYLVVTLSNFYRLLFMFYANSQFFNVTLISKRINFYLEELMVDFKEERRNKF